MSGGTQTHDQHATAVTTPMASSRTGSAVYKRNSARKLHTAQQQGLTRCPCTANCKSHRGRTCSIPLDYNNRRRPNGASIDHITPWNNGGTDHIENLTIICLLCNTTIGDKRPRHAQPQHVPQHIPPHTPHTTRRRPGQPHAG